MFVYLKAQDIEGNESPLAMQPFTFDVKPPEIIVDRPAVLGVPSREGTLTGGSYAIYYPSGARPKWVSNVVITGGITKDAFGISKIYYHIGPLGDDKATTDAEREAIYNAPGIWEDTNLDSFPYAQYWGGSVYWWTYTRDFINDPPSASLIQQHTDLTGKIPDQADFRTTGMTRYYLPFYVKVLDSAGNYQITHFKLCVDPDLDIPQADINYPAPDMDDPSKDILVGGEVRLGGTAEDNNWVHSVLLRITREDAAPGVYYLPPGANWFYPNDHLLRYAAPEDSPVPDTKGWFRATKIGEDTKVSWYCYINGDSGLDPPEGKPSVGVKIEVRAIDTKDQNHIIPDLVGLTTSLDVKFSTGVPTINNVTIIKEGVPDRDYSNDIRVSGTFKISMKIRDDEQVKEVKARFAGSADYISLISNRNIVTSPLPDPKVWHITAPQWNPAISREECTLTVTIDSTSFTNLGYGRTGNLVLEIQVDDNNDPSYRTNGTFSIGIDNFYPVTQIGTQTNASGKFFEINGIARDYGSGSGVIQDLERILVYFEEVEVSYPGGIRTVNKFNPGRFLNPRGVRPNAQDPFYAGNGSAEFHARHGIGNTYGRTKWATIPPMNGVYQNMMDTTDPGYNFASPPVKWNVESFQNFPLLEQIEKPGHPYFDKVWESPHAMVIDRQELGNDIDLDDDGTHGEVWNGIADKEWLARMDTTLFKDGPLMVHYIIMDKAGNATHYEKEIFIENKKPLITFINLGTDIDGDEIISPWISEANPGEFMRTKEPIGTTTRGNSKLSFDPAFRIRNNMFRIMIETDPNRGNGEKFYRVSYVQPGTRISAASMERGKVYTIETPGTTDWQKYGALNNTVNTTFVASGRGDGNGFVIPYTEGEVFQKASFGMVGGNPVHAVNNITFIPSFFEPKGGAIAESNKTGGVITVHNQRLFIIRVYDSTIPGAPENEQLAHAVLVALDIDNIDTVPPNINAAPFGEEYVPSTTIIESPNKSLVPVGQNYYNKNIVTVGAQRKGYVEYAADSGGNANISGKVIFMGSADDDQRITRITAKIDGYKDSEEFDIARWNTATKRMDPHDGANFILDAATYVNRSISMVAEDTAEWGFESVSEYLTLNYGHDFNWRFAWDSSLVYGMTANDVNVTFKVFDAGGKANESTITVNIVPYISEVVTGLSNAYGAIPSAFARSANGWYPVRENEVITIRGFNLGVNGTTTAVSINGTPLTYNAATSANTPTSGNFRVDSKTQISANVGTSAASGALVVSVGAGPATRVNSLNNRNNVNAHYNREPNDLNNNILTDDRYLYVWNTGYLNNQRVMQSPFMRMHNNAAWTLIYGSSSSNPGYLYVAQNSNTPVQIQQDTNRYLNTTLAIDGAGDWYAGASNQTAGADRTFSIYARGTTSGGNNANGSSHRRLLVLDNDANRVRTPRIAVQNTNNNSTATDANATRVFTSFYDSAKNDNAVFFKYGLVGGSLSTTAGFGGDFPADGIAGASSSTGTVNVFGSVQTVANNSTDHKGSMYMAVGALDNGRPVIAWFDGINRNLVFSYGGNNAGTVLGTSVTTLAALSQNVNSKPYVYIAENHGLSVSTINATNTNATRVLVSSGSTNNLNFVRGSWSDEFTLNSSTTAATNVGADYGESIEVTAPVAVTNISGTNRTYTVGINHGLSNDDAVYYVYNVTAAGAAATLGYVRGLNDNSFQLYTAPTGGSIINTSATNAGQMYLYPVKNRIPATRSSGTFYSAAAVNTGIIENRIVTASTTGSTQYRLVKVYGNQHFQLVFAGTGNPANIATSFTLSADAAGNFITTSTGAIGNPGTWQGNAAIVHRGAGSHVDLAVDEDDNVHLAYYDVNNGGLYYALIPPTGTGIQKRPDTTGIRTARVDTYLSAGTRLMINVRRENHSGITRNVPYISYFHSSFSETKNAIRIAWRKDFTTAAPPHGTDILDRFTGAWEVMTVPVQTVPFGSEIVCNGVPTSGSLVSPGGNLTSRPMSKTIMLGYMTTDWYEGAVLKHDIY